MIIIIELIALAVCLVLTGKKIKRVLHMNSRLVLWGVLSGLVYSLVIFLLRQTAIGSSIFDRFVGSIGLQFSILYTIYPFFIAISEEFIFRYFIARHWGIIISSLLFTILHWRPDFPTPLFVLIFILGLSQSWLFKKTKSIWPPVIAHVFILYFLIIG